MAQLGFGLNINETAAKFGYDQYSTRLGETLSAVASDNWNFNPLSSIGTYYDMQSARSQALEDNQVRISRDELNKYSLFGSKLEIYLSRTFSDKESLRLTFL